jgi:hypothetical protein
MQAYDILRDDANLRALRYLPRQEAASTFDRLRDEYVFRPEFHHFVVELAASDSDLAACLARLGFQVSICDSPTPCN